MRRRHFLAGLMGSAFLGTGPALGFEVTKSDVEWKTLLSPAAYNVLRHQDTEAPFTSPLNNEHRKGIFACAGCGLDLYSSDTKFDSGTGWPSFIVPCPMRWDIQGSLAVHGTHRSALPPLRRASGACV
jgi:peptide-methionine (R)-S-oxide reductase